MSAPAAVSPLDRVLSRLADVVRNGVGFYARCPVHGGEPPRLHVRADARGRVELRCPAGCKAGAIVDALGFDADDLRPDAPSDRPAPSDARGDVRARAAAEGRPVLLCESRGSALALADLGYTTSFLDVPGGVWKDGLARAYRELAEVVLVPDGGARSRVLAERAGAAIHRLGVAVRLVRLPGLAGAETVVDWLDAHGEDDAEARDAFDAEVEQSPAWAPDEAPPAPSRFEVLTDTELEELPPPEWLWGGLLVENTLAALIGQPGAGKSFVALDLAARVAAGGGNALGRPVRAGTVLYVAAEGTAGLPQRLAAWKHAHGHAGRSIPLRFIKEPVNLFAGDDDAELVAACRQIATAGAPVRLVILDTLARVMPGGEENSAKDMGLVMAHADRVRRATGAVVLIVHHTAKNSDTERGSTALRGAVDTVLLVKADDPDAPEGVKLLITDKQKDAPASDPVVFTLEPVAADTAHGRVTSCRVALSAVRWTDAPDADAPLTFRQLDILRTLRGFGTAGATATEWCDATQAPKKSFYRAREVLDRGGYVLVDTRNRGARYQVTAFGQRALSAPKDSVVGVNVGVAPGVTPGAAGGGGVTPPLRGSDYHHPGQRGVAGRPATSTAPTATPKRDTEAPRWFDREFSDDEAPT